MVGGGLLGSRFLLSRTDGHTLVSIDVEGTIILHTACNKVTDLVVTVMGCGREAIMVVGRLFYVWQFHWRTPGTLQHRVFPHINLNGGMFQHGNVRPRVARVSREFLQRHNVLTVPGTKYNICGMHWVRRAGGIPLRHFRNFVRAATWTTEHSTTCCTTFDCPRASPLSSCYQGSWWS